LAAFSSARRTRRVFRPGIKTHLGIDSGNEVWNQAAGPTVFAPFSNSTDYSPAEKQWMLNLRVSELDLLVQQLGAAGIAVLRKPEWDPEGNPIEL
jgi:hypothetical protein